MPPRQKLEITYTLIGDLVPDPLNPRKIDDAEFETLTHGIEFFGMVDPIIARSEDKLVIGGHQRLRVAKEDGQDEVPVVFLSGLSDKEARALNVLLNNRKAQGEFDTPKLLDVFAGLSDGADEFDLALTGFTVPEVEDLKLSILGPSGDGGSQEIPEQWAVLIDCPDESMQTELLKRFNKEGLKCRALIT